MVTAEMVTAETFANRRAALDAAARIYTGAIMAEGYSDRARADRPGLIAEEVMKLAARFDGMLRSPHDWDW